MVVHSAVHPLAPFVVVLKRALERKASSASDGTRALAV
jgi:hypothetical protein